MDILTYIEKHFKFVSIFFLNCRQNHTVVGPRIEYEVEQNVLRIIMTYYAGLSSTWILFCPFTGHWISTLYIVTDTEKYILILLELLFLWSWAVKNKIYKVCSMLVNLIDVREKKQGSKLKPRAGRAWDTDRSRAAREWVCHITSVPLVSGARAFGDAAANAELNSLVTEESFRMNIPGTVRAGVPAQ